MQPVTSDHTHKSTIFAGHLQHALAALVLGATASLTSTAEASGFLGCRTAGYAWVACTDPAAVECVDLDYPNGDSPSCISYGFTVSPNDTQYCVDMACSVSPNSAATPTPMPTATPTPEPTVTPTPTPADCTFGGQTVAHGSGVTAYLSDQVPSGQTCQGETRTCNNGSLSGSYAYPACTVALAPGHDLLP